MVVFHCFLLQTQIEYFYQNYSVVPIFTKQMVYHQHIVSQMSYSVNVGRSQFSSSVIKMSTKTSPKGESMATPSVSTCVLDSKVK